MYSFGQNVGYKACYYLYSLLATYEVYEIYTIICCSTRLMSEYQAEPQKLHSDAFIF